MIKENLRKDLFVKQIQAPRPEPNEINHEYCDRDYENCSNRAEPFENALKHVVGLVLVGCNSSAQWIQEFLKFTQTKRQLTSNAKPENAIQEFLGGSSRRSK